MNRRSFLKRVAVGAVAIVAASALARMPRAWHTGSLQFMLDHGIPIPPGDYVTTETLHVRRSYTRMVNVNLTSAANPVIHLHGNVRNSEFRGAINWLC